MFRKNIDWLKTLNLMSTIRIYHGRKKAFYELDDLERKAQDSRK